MKVIQEFKAFALKGNVIDMAVGIVIGAGFGRIVSSLVDNIIMPPLGIIVGGVNFKDLSLVLKQASEGVPAVTLKYGEFIQTVFDFTIIAFCIFLVVKMINRMKKKEAANPTVAPPRQEVLLQEIRDLLKK